LAGPALLQQLAAALNLYVGGARPGLLQAWLLRCVYVGGALPALLQPWLPGCMPAVLGPHCCGRGAAQLNFGGAWPALLQPWLLPCMPAVLCPRCCSPGCLVVVACEPHALWPCGPARQSIAEAEA